MTQRFPPGPANFNAWCGLTWRHAFEQWHHPLAFCESLARNYGDLVFYRLFTYQAYQINHPALVREVLVTQGRYFNKQSRQMALIRPMTGNGLLNSDGELWQRQRRIMNPGFQGEHTRVLTNVGLIETERTLDRWQDGETIRVHEEMLRITVSATAQALFSSDPDGETSEIAEAMTSVSAGLFEDMTNPFPLPVWLPWRRVRQKVEGLRKISSFVAERIARRRASGRLGNDILGLLLSAVDAEDGKGMSDAQAHSEAMTLFFAAHHTNAACLAWTLYLLSQHPDVEQRAVAEIAEHASRLPLNPHGVALPYVEQILQESLRLYPPAWSLFTRESIADVELGGYRIPARSWFFIYPWVLHHDERFFPNPWKFDPDRFAESRAETIPNGAYIPFGLGGHACAGTKMALNFLNSVLPAILKRFSFTLAAEQGPVIPEPLLSLRPQNDIRMVVRRRSSLPVVSPVQAHAVS